MKKLQIYLIMGLFILFLFIGITSMDNDFFVHSYSNMIAECAYKSAASKPAPSCIVHGPVNPKPLVVTGEESPPINLRWPRTNDKSFLTDAFCKDLESRLEVCKKQEFKNTEPCLSPNVAGAKTLCESKKELDHLTLRNYLGYAAIGMAVFMLAGLFRNQF
ncbi:MAG: hypothetical protein EOP00_29425 [Pedobacter sp.]|nr:MAG: hypothetical protein EOP00_29425 [Pedobacter sp.]